MLTYYQLRSPSGEWSINFIADRTTPSGSKLIKQFALRASAECSCKIDGARAQISCQDSMHLTIDLEKMAVVETYR